MALLGRKFPVYVLLYAIALLYVLFYAITLLYLGWALDILDRPSPLQSDDELQRFFEELHMSNDYVIQHSAYNTPSSDNELQRLFEDLDTSKWLSSSTTCKDFLLAGAAEDPSADRVGKFEWEGGVWINPPEARNETWAQQQVFLTFSQGLHEATFSIIPGASIEVEWGKLTDLVRTFGGRLVLRDFWNDYMPWGDRDLKLMLHGAFVSTGEDRRVCMTGCAFRHDFPNELDCGFILKMKYPNCPSLAASRVEGELSSESCPGDPLHNIPAMRILGARAFTGSEYEFRSEEFLQTALNMSSSDNIENDGFASPQDLVSYLGGPSMKSPQDTPQGPSVEYIAQVAPTAAELSQIGERGEVVVGPFRTPYFPLHEGLLPSTVELVFRFMSVVTRPTGTGRRVLVSASMTASLRYFSSFWDSSVEDEQAPFNMEGIWDPASEELCMLGSRDAEIVPWKLCLKSVLRRYVSIDSPLEGAVLSGPNFASLALLRFYGAGDGYNLATYRYTVAGKAEELARRATSPEMEALKDMRWFHPRFPAPANVPDVCTAVERVRSALDAWSGHAYGADGEIMGLNLNDFRVTFVESCGRQNLDVPWDAPLKDPVAGSYLRVAVRISLASSNWTEKVGLVYRGRPCNCHAEGVYEPFTGKLHLVVHQRQSELIDGVEVRAAAIPWPVERNGGGEVEAVEDAEIYMQLQYHSLDSSAWEYEAVDPDPRYTERDEYIAYDKVNMRVESLRSQSDPLYFKPLVAKNYPNYKPSPDITIVSSTEQESAHSWFGPLPSPFE